MAYRHIGEKIVDSVGTGKTLNVAGGAVDSVNGQKGVVVISIADIATLQGTLNDLENRVSALELENGG